jgi:hypothetical protein
LAAKHVAFPLAVPASFTASHHITFGSPCKSFKASPVIASGVQSGARSGKRKASNLANMHGKAIAPSTRLYEMCPAWIR